MCVCVFAPHMCVGSGTQRFILGLNQASAPEDCRLMWPISSDYSCMVTVSLTHTCIHVHSVAARKSLGMWFTHYFSKKDFVCFSNQPPVCHYAFLSVYFSLALFTLFRDLSPSASSYRLSIFIRISTCFFSFMFFSFISFIIVSINSEHSAHQ